MSDRLPHGEAQRPDGTADSIFAWYDSHLARRADGMRAAPVAGDLAAWPLAAAPVVQAAVVVPPDGFWVRWRRGLSARARTGDGPPTRGLPQAFLYLLFLGLLGAHRIYLRSYVGAGFLILSHWLAWQLPIAWCLVDLALLPYLVDRENSRLRAEHAAAGAAPATPEAVPEWVRDERNAGPARRGILALNNALTGFYWVLAPSAMQLFAVGMEQMQITYMVYLMMIFFATLASPRAVKKSFPLLSQAPIIAGVVGWMTRVEDFYTKNRPHGLLTSMLVWSPPALLPALAISQRARREADVMMTGPLYTMLFVLALGTIRSRNSVFTPPLNLVDFLFYGIGSILVLQIFLLWFLGPAVADGMRLQLSGRVTRLRRLSRVGLLVLVVVDFGSTDFIKQRTSWPDWLKLEMRFGNISPNRLVGRVYERLTGDLPSEVPTTAAQARFRTHLTELSRTYLNSYYSPDGRPPAAASDATKPPPGGLERFALQYANRFKVADPFDSNVAAKYRKILGGFIPGGEAKAFNVNDCPAAGDPQRVCVTRVVNMWPWEIQPTREIIYSRGNKGFAVHDLGPEPIVLPPLPSENELGAETIARLERLVTEELKVDLEYEVEGHRIKLKGLVPSAETAAHILDTVASIHGVDGVDGAGLLPRASAAENLATATISFGPGSDQVEAAALPQLEELAAFLGRNPALRLGVGGHTDSSGNAAGNQALSERRAQAVRRWLVDYGKIDPARLVTTGHAARLPIASDATEAGRARNRRVAFELPEAPSPCPPAAQAGGPTP